MKKILNNWPPVPSGRVRYSQLVQLEISLKCRGSWVFIENFNLKNQEKQKNLHFEYFTYEILASYSRIFQFLNTQFLIFLPFSESFHQILVVPIRGLTLEWIFDPMVPLAKTNNLCLPEHLNNPTIRTAEFWSIQIHLWHLKIVLLNFESHYDNTIISMKDDIHRSFAVCWQKDITCCNFNSYACGTVT